MKEDYINLEEDLSIEENKYLTFSIGDDPYGLDIKYVDDIIGVQDITKVPDQPTFLKGVINLRGVIIPVIDIRLRFDKEERAYDDRTCIIVVNIDNAAVGIVVDTVLEVVAIEDEAIAEPPSFNGEVENQYMKGIGQINEQIVIIIDCYELIREN